jgi:peroxiredoxin
VGEEGRDRPLELPTIPLLLHTPVPRVGDVAPGFTAKRLEGGSLKLSDFRGRYVLLNFWATSCGPCLRQTDSLKTIHDEFGKDGRLVMIGLSTDESRGPPLRYTRENAMSWHQCFIGPDGAAATAYGVTGIPSIWLIGPEGKVVANKLHGEGIRAAVRRALGASL